MNNDISYPSRKNTREFVQEFRNAHYSAWNGKLGGLTTVSLIAWLFVRILRLEREVRKR